MKKMLIGITALLLITLGTLYFTSIFIEKQALQVNAVLNQLEKSIKNDDWKEAEKYLSPLYEHWQKARATWSIFLDHTEIDSLDSAMHRVMSLVRLRDKVFSLTEIAVTRGIVLHIPEIEHVGFSTVF